MTRTTVPIAVATRPVQLSRPGPSPWARGCGIAPVTPKINTWIPHSSGSRGIGATERMGCRFAEAASLLKWGRVMRLERFTTINN
jgi:hypothetical protein